jgi:hypothetical protein
MEKKYDELIKICFQCCFAKPIFFWRAFLSERKGRNKLM